MVVESLISKLPSSLKISADELSGFSAKMNRAKTKLDREKDKRGYIKLRGENYPSFGRDIFDLKEGEFLWRQ